MGTATDLGSGFGTASSSRRPHSASTGASAAAVTFLAEARRRLGEGSGRVWPEVGAGAKRRAQSWWRPKESQQREEAAREAGAVERGVGRAQVAQTG